MCCSTTKIQEAFAKGISAYFVCLEAAEKNVTVKTWSLVKKSGFVSTTVLFPLILCPVPLTLSSVAASTGQRLLPLICRGNPFGKGELWSEVWHGQHLTLPRCGCPHRETLTLARALCVLAKPAGSHVPRDPGSGTRAAPGCTPVFRRAWSRDPESSAEPSLHCPHKSPSQLTVRLVPRPLYERESSLFRTESSVSLPNPTGSRVQR